MLGGGIGGGPGSRGRSGTPGTRGRSGTPRPDSWPLSNGFGGWGIQAAEGAGTDPATADPEDPVDLAQAFSRPCCSGCSGGCWRCAVAAADIVAVTVVVSDEGGGRTPVATGGAPMADDCNGQRSSSSGRSADATGGFGVVDRGTGIR